MDKMEISKETLVRYLNCETSLAEEKAIMNWLEADEKNRKEFDELDFIFGSSVMSHKVKPRRRSLAARDSWRYFVFAACCISAVVLALAGGSVYSNRLFEQRAAQTMELNVPVGQRINLTLADGTKVTLNSGSRLVYPAVFSGSHRDVSISGEAMFDVAHDAEHPFVVSTYAGSVEALGTKFSVKAKESDDIFSAALLEGSIKVCDAASAMSLVLKPGEKVSSLNGAMVKEEISDRDDFLWTDGIISLSGKSFEDLMKNYESAYGFNIIYRTDSIPLIRCNGKIRIADGIEHAIAVLKTGGTKFNYEVNYNLNEVYIW